MHRSNTITQFIDDAATSPLIDFGVLDAVEVKDAVAAHLARIHGEDLRVADYIEAHPEQSIREAKVFVARFMDSSRHAKYRWVLERWNLLLETKTASEIAQMFREGKDETEELRSSAPFCGEALTMDVDLFPPWDESKAAVWAAADFSIGRLSAFRREHGFYVERVAEWTTRQLLPGWEKRVSTFEVNGIQASAIHPFDLICAKLQAGRTKDRSFVKKSLELGVVKLTEIESFLHTHSEDAALSASLSQQLHDALNFTEEED